MLRFDLHWLHEMAESEPCDEAQWKATMPDNIPWPGVESLQEVRRLYGKAHEAGRASGRACRHCAGSGGVDASCP